MNYLKGLPKEEYLSNVVNCSARTTAQQMQELIMSKLDRRRKGVYGPPVGKRVNFRSLLVANNDEKRKFLPFSARYLWMT